MVILKPIKFGFDSNNSFKSEMFSKSKVEYLQSDIPSFSNFLEKKSSENEYEIFLPISPNSRMFCNLFNKKVTFICVVNIIMYVISTGACGMEKSVVS